MNRIRATHCMQRPIFASPRATPHITTRTHTSSPPSRTGRYYNSFGSPVLKCFLGALFTYQLTYYAWMKLEAVEEAHDKDMEILELRRELEEVVAGRKGGVGAAAGKGDVQEGTAQVEGNIKKSWWPW